MRRADTRRDAMTARLALHFAGPVLHGSGGTVQTGGGKEGGPLAGCQGENRERGCCVICSAIPADVHGLADAIQERPLSVRRYFCRRLRGLPGILISNSVMAIRRFR